MYARGVHLVYSLVPRPHPSAREKGLVKNDNIPGQRQEFRSPNQIAVFVINTFHSGVCKKVVL